MDDFERYLSFGNGEERTLESALEDESNMLNRLTYVEKWRKFQVEIEQNEDAIREIVSQHIGIDIGCCQLSEEWLCGGFNLSIPVFIRDHRYRYQKLIFRIPLHFKLGESLFPGNVDEKIKTEAAAYIFVRQHCPDVPILELLGFGLTNGGIYSPEGKKQSETDFRLGYVLIPFVEDARLLSEVLKKEDSPRRRVNLYRGISRIMIHLAQVEHPQIGSLAVTEGGAIQMSNRPLFLRLQWLENEGIETNIARDKTYESTLSYWHDLLSGHDNRLRCQPNSITDREDGQKQMAALQILRERMHQLLDFSPDKVGFRLTMTDLTAANIFVDEEWHIVAIIDLDGTCFWPIEMLHPPMWLTSKAIDELVGEEEGRFEVERTEFMNIFREEESILCENGLSDRMDLNWRRGSCWCGIILGNTSAAYNLIRHHFMPRFHDLRNFDEAYESKAMAWTEGSEEFIQRKLDDLEEYRKQVKATAWAKE